MPTYKMMSVADFRTKMKNGDYDSAGGARKAIGKMKEWSEADRDTAKSFVAKHFGEDAPAKKTEGRKPRPEKKAAKKVAAKAKPAKAEKATKAAKPAKAEKKIAAKPAAKVKPEKKAAAAKTKAVKAKMQATMLEDDGTFRDRLTEYQDAVGVYKDAADTLKKCESEGLNVSEGLKTCADGLSALIKGMDKHIVQPLTSQEQAGAELFAKAAAIAPPVVAPFSSDDEEPSFNHTFNGAPPAFPTAGVVPPRLPGASA
jgi:hypothetical protein